LSNMSSIINLSALELRRAAEIKEQIQLLENEFGRILESSAKPMAAAHGSKKRRKMSTAGRARIAAAQKARWAKVRGTKSKVGPAQKPKRKISEAAKAKISAAAKARWAKIKKGEKS
jgi:hypothetical protein